MMMDWWLSRILLILLFRLVLVPGIFSEIRVKPAASFRRALYYCPDLTQRLESRLDPRGLVVAFLLPALALTAGLSRGAEDDSLETMRRLVADGAYAQGETLARRYIEQEEQAGRGETTNVAEATLVLVEALWRGGKERAPGTREAAERCVELCRRVYGEEHPKYATSLTALAIVLRRNDDVEGAKALTYRVLALREKIFGPRSIEVAQTLSNLAAPEGMSGNFSAAKAALERASSICEELGARDEFFSNVLYNLGFLNEQLGDYATSRDDFERSLEIRRQVLPPGHPSIAVALFGLGMALTHLGEFEAARASCEQALAMQEKTLGPDHPEFAESLDRLAVVLARTGRPADARPLQERALAILERALGSDHSRVSQVRGDLASLLAGMGDGAEAKRLLEITVANQERVLGPDHADLGRSLNRLADVELQLGDLAAAQRHLVRARAILEAIYGKAHPDVAASLDGLARLRRLRGEYALAESLFRQALDIRRSRLGDSHPLVAEDLSGLAKVEWAQGKARPAFEDSLQAESILRSQFGRALGGLSEREALDYEKVRSSGLDTALSILASKRAQVLPENAVERGWMAVVRSRALVLDRMASMHRTAEGQDDPAAAGLLRDLVAATHRLAALVVRGPDPARPDRYLPELRRAGEEKEDLERRLADKNASFRRRLEQGDATFEALERSLPRATALVAYVLYEQSEPGKNPPAAVPAYVAFVLGSGIGHPLSIPIGGAAEIDRLVEDWRQASTSPSASLALDRERHDRELREIGGRLRSRLWDPVARVLGDCAQVLVVPDGAVNLLNLATLPAGQDRFLVDDGPRFHYLSAERDLPELGQAKPARGSGILLVGGPDFDMGHEAPPPTAVARRFRGSAASCSDFGTMRFDPLPASIKEVDEIRSLLAARAAGSNPAISDVIALTAAEAGEAAVKNVAPGHRILHLATHGFFVDDRCLSSLRSGSAVDGPLLLSGLALAGANRRREASPESEDGILTSEEIATLDLRGVDWVVLSACESGIGRIQSGEGVLGLRRAFQVAGVRTLITSLWKVEDDVTKEWMRHLYEGRLRGLSTSEAVRNAGLAVLNARRAKGLSTDPFFWGAFVAAGDWR